MSDTENLSESDKAKVDFGVLCEANLEGDFVKGLLERAAHLRDYHLSASRDNSWDAGAAFAYGDLTNLIDRCIAEKERIIAEQKEVTDRRKTDKAGKPKSSFRTMTIS